MTEEYSFAPWLAARARRLRVYRLITLSFWFFVAVGLAINVFRWALPIIPAAVWGIMWLPFGITFSVVALPWFVISTGFMYGGIKCPSCDSRFSQRFPPAWVPRACQNCGFDIYTLR